MIGRILFPFWTFSKGLSPITCFGGYPGQPREFLIFRPSFLEVVFIRGG
ncbi:hypothetical protein BAL199_16118 [alpha proteobacterium BAL199]|nr:hypothetical protein BAL199_16118 [alpha proteobacterium BAL199]